jgi:Uma2 family endonuclease
MDHGDCGTEIAYLLKDFVKKHDLGKVYSADTGFKLSEDTVRGPDVSFVRKDRVPAVHGKGFGKGAPELLPAFTVSVGEIFP